MDIANHRIYRIQIKAEKDNKNSVNHGYNKFLFKVVISDFGLRFEIEERHKSRTELLFWDKRMDGYRELLERITRKEKPKGTRYTDNFSCGCII